MGNIQLRNIPDDLYEEIANKAQDENRTIPQQTIVMLRRSLIDIKLHQAERKSVIDQLQKKEWPAVNFNVVEELRKDRDER